MSEVLIQDEHDERADEMKDSSKTSCSWMKWHFTHLVSYIVIVCEFAKLKWTW